MKTLIQKFELSIFVVLLTLISYSGIAQKRHFIYFFTDNKQAFNLTINTTNFQSSENGHLILSRVKNGKYFIAINFPSNKYPEQKFSFVVADNDMGFSLKQSPQGDWALQNIVTNDYYAANSADWDKEKAVNDTIQVDKTFVIETKKTNTTEVKEGGKETKTKAVDTTKESSSTETGTNSSESNSNKKSAVQITKERSTNDGITAVYIDYTVNPNDTIILFIPYDDTASSKVNPKKEEVDDKSKTTETTTVEPAKDETEVVETDTKYQKGDYNTSCVNLATEVDYNRTRKLMSAETSDENMIKAAIKSFRNKCVYVEQLKKLGLLFISEQSRLKFFTASKPYIYDRLNYEMLEAEFKLYSNIENFRKTLF